MIIEFGRKEQQKMLFVHSTLEEAIDNFKSQCGKAYQTVTKLHQKFFNQLKKYQSNKQSVIKKIMCLENSYQIILLQICGACQTIDLSQMGKIVIKMHLQSMEIIKWLVKNLGQFSTKSIENSLTNLNVYETYANQLREREKKNLNYYYRVKQNSMFTAKGIDKQLDKMTENLNMQSQQKQQQIKKLLNTKQLINKIQPSESEQILLQAVQIISHHGQVFKKLTKQNKQNFIDNFKGLNIKPYSKVKNEIEECMKQKIQVAMKKMWMTFKKFIDNKNSNGLQTKVQTCSYGTQANLGKDVQEKYHRQDKKKSQKLRQALANASYHKSRAEKLEQLLRHKAIQQQKMLKQKHQNMLKKTEKQIAIKKSYKELTSLNKINDLSQKHLQDRSISKSKKIVDFNVNPNYQGHKIKLLNKKIDAHYQKSLTRIQFNIFNQNGNENGSSSQSSQHSIQIQTNLLICKQQVNIVYDFTYLTGTKRTCLCGIPLTERNKNNRHTVLSLCSNVLEQIVRQPNLQIKRKLMNRNKSLLTITNLKSSAFKKQNRESQRQSKRDSTKNFKVNQFSEFANEPMTPNSKIPGQRRNRKQMTQQICFSNLFEDDNNGEKQKMLHIVNKPNIGELVFQIVQSSKQTKTFDQKQNQQIKELQKCENAQINNNFQLLNMNMNEEPQLRNKRRVNAMMTQLKKKRLYKQGLPGDLKRSYGSTKCTINIFSPSILLDLYFKQQYAMEAQIEYGVSVSNMITGSRKIILKEKDQIDPKKFTSQKNQQYIQQMTKNIQKSLMVQRQKNSKIYKQIQTMIKYPLSTIKGSTITEKQKIKDDLALNEIKNFIRFITNLHAHCDGKPCQHLKEFLKKINVKIN